MEAWCYFLVHGEELDTANLPATLRTALGVAIREGYYAGLSPTLEQLTGTRGRSTTAVLSTHRAALETIFEG